MCLTLSFMMLIQPVMFSMATPATRVPRLYDGNVMIDGLYEHQDHDGKVIECVPIKGYICDYQGSMMFTSLFALLMMVNHKDNILFVNNGGTSSLSMGSHNDYLIIMLVRTGSDLIVR